MRNIILFMAAATVVATTHARPRAEKAADFEAKQAAWEQHQALQASSPFAQLQWRDIGPVIQGGRLVDIEVVPGQPYSFYVAYASGGVWKTDNNGVTFEPLSDPWPSMIIGDIALDPNDPNTLWIGTGENNASRSSYGGMGVYLSRDGGRTVQHMGLGDSDRIGKILVDPSDSKRILVGAAGKLYSSGGQRGVFLSEDAGQSWTEVLPGGPWTGVIDMAFEPGNSQTVYAATWERSRRPWNFVEGGDGSAIWRSRDGGRSFQRLSDGLPSGQYVGRIGLATAASSPQTLYACIDNQEPLPESEWDMGDAPLTPKRLRNMSREQFLSHSKAQIEAFIQSNDLQTDIDADDLISMLSNDQLSMQQLIDEISDANASLFNTDIKSLELYRSDDGGDSWARTHDSPIQKVVYSYGYYFGQCRVSPVDPDRVYLLGVPIITSADGGKTFEGINQPSVHVDHQSMWIDPNHPDRLLLGNDGGLDMSFDGGKSWITVDSQPVGQFYSVAVDMADPYNVYGGLQDNGTLKGSSRNRWQDGPTFERINGGDGMHVNIDDRDGTVYTGYQFGWYSRSGKDGRHEVRPRDKLGEPALRYNWNTPVKLSPHNQDIVYFGANRLYRSMDRGQTWTSISADLSQSKERGDVPYATLTTLAESPLSFGLLWAGTDDGQLWVTESSGHQWTDVADRLPAKRWVSRVVASAHQRDRAYVTFNGYRDDDIAAYVFATDNLGQRWRNISANLPAEPVNVLVEDPVNAEVLYVGTDRGVYVSIDRGNHWHALQGGLPNVPVHDLVVHPRERELVAGTHGRSIWIVDVLPIQDWAEQADQALAVFHIDQVQASRQWYSRPSAWFSRPQDAPQATIHFRAEQAGPVTVDIEDENQQRLRRWRVNATAGLNRIDWDLLVDLQAAIAAEQGHDDDNSDQHLSYQQRQQLGHPALIKPGDYTVRVHSEAAEASAALTVLPIDAPEPRVAKPPAIRGKRP